MITFSGKIGVDKAGPTILKWPVTTVTAVKGALLELESATPEVFDGTGNVFAMTQSAIVSADTVAELALVSKGSKLVADFGLDALTSASTSSKTVFTDASCVGGTDDMFVGAQLEVVSGGTAANAGIYTITAYTSSSGAFTVEPAASANFNGEVAYIRNIEGTGTRLIGMITPVLDATASYVKLDGTWNGDDFMVIGTVAPNKLLLAVLNSDF